MSRYPRLLRLAPLALGLAATLGVAVIFAVAPASTDVLGQTAPMFLDADDNRNLEDNEKLEGTIRPAGDVDTYFFDGVEGQRIRVRLRVTDGNLLPVVEIRNSANETLAEERVRERRGNQRVQVRLDFTVPADDTYRVVVWGLDRTTGSYELRLNFLGDGNGDDEDDEDNEGDEEGDE
jgi:hypothetical protein